MASAHHQRHDLTSPTRMSSRSTLVQYSGTCIAVLNLVRRAVWDRGEGEVQPARGHGQVSRDGQHRRSGLGRWPLDGHRRAQPQRRARGRRLLRAMVAKFWLPICGCLVNMMVSVAVKDHDQDDHVTEGEWGSSRNAPGSLEVARASARKVESETRPQHTSRMFITACKAVN